MELTITGMAGAQLSELKRIENRIQSNLSAAYANIVDVGRCLNEVRQKRLVPQGEWEQWLTQKTGMSARTAQRWMQIAREVPEGSWLSRLEISKIREILALPEPDREALAQRAYEEDMSVKTLKEEIDRRGELNETLKGAVENQRARADRAEQDVKNLHEYGERQSERIRELERQLANAQSATADKGISAEAAREIERLKQELSDAEEFGNLQSEKRREAQLELMKLKNKGADDMDAGAGFTESVNRFIRDAGFVTQMAKEFAFMDEGERRVYEIGVGIISDWLKGVTNALSFIGGEAAQL